MDLQDDSSALRRGLLRLAWIVGAAIVLWLIVWFVFIRNSSPEVSKVHESGTNTKQSQSSSSNKNTKSSPSTSTNTNSSPDQLANAGAGNVIALFAIATAVGTAASYARMRYKLRAQ